MIKDRRKTERHDGPQRRYEDAKAASASAAERIARATADAVKALRGLSDDLPLPPQHMWGRS